MFLLWYFLQHFFILCRIGAFRHPIFIENASNTKAGINLEKSSVLEGAKPKRTRGAGVWRDTPDVVSDSTRGWLLLRLTITPHRKGEGTDQTTPTKKNRSGRLPSHALLATHPPPDWGELGEEPDRRREREKRAPGDWWRCPIHRLSPTTTPTCCTSSSSTSRNGAVDPLQRPLADPLQLGFAGHLRPCCSPSPTTSTAHETTLNLSSLTIVFWIFALNILQLVIWISVNYWCVREKTRWFNL